MHTVIILIDLVITMNRMKKNLKNPKQGNKNLQEEPQRRDRRAINQMLGHYVIAFVTSFSNKEK